MQRETCHLEKKENIENKYYKVLANRFRLITSKLMSSVKEQQSCLWPTLHQMDFIKR